MDSEQSLQLTSSAFAEGDSIPAQYTCKGENISPPLHIHGVPEGTVSLALIVHDPDAPTGDYLHWTIWNIPPHLGLLPENTVPDGAFQGTNDFGQATYGGPCPPSGTHHYLFELYALDEQPDLAPGATREEVEEVVNTHSLAHTTLTGTFSAEGE